jgi:hypothetical protein
MQTGRGVANSRGNAASLFRVEDEGSRFLHNPGTHLPDYMVSFATSRSYFRASFSLTTKLLTMFKLFKLLMKNKWL